MTDGVVVVNVVKKDRNTGGGNVVKIKGFISCSQCAENGAYASCGKCGKK